MSFFSKLYITIRYSTYRSVSVKLCDTVFIDDYECVIRTRIWSRILLILAAPVIISTSRSAANLRSLMGVVSDAGVCFIGRFNFL